MQILDNIEELMKSKKAIKVIKQTQRHEISICNITIQRARPEIVKTEYWPDSSWMCKIKVKLDHVGELPTDYFHGYNWMEPIPKKDVVIGNLIFRGCWLTSLEADQLHGTIAVDHIEPVRN